VKVNSVKKADDSASDSSGGSSSENDSEEDSDEGSDEEKSEAEKDVPEKSAPKRKASPELNSFDDSNKKAKVDGEEGSSNILFVGQLPWSIDDAGLLNAFDQFGNITECRVVYDRNSGRSKGFGYVHFETHDEARQARDAMHQKYLEGRTINVDFAGDRPQNRPQGGNSNPKAQANARASRYGDTPGNPSTTLFVGNLSFEADEDTVRSHFEQFGTITRCRLPTDINDGSPKGFGYVDFSSIEEATTAYDAMVGSQINGRTIRLDYAQPRTDNGGGGGGGFGGRGGRGGGRGGGGFGGRGGGRDGGFGGRGGGGRGGGRGGGGGFRGGRGGGFSSTNRGGFNSYSGNMTTF